MIPSWKALNNEERWVGAIYGVNLTGLLWAVWGSWWAAILPAWTMYAWAAGGAKKEDGGNKLWRRGGCSIIPGAMGFFSTSWNIWTLPSIPLAWWILAWGYGIPTYAPGRPDDDKGSLLGRFAYNLAGKIWSGPVALEVLQIRATAIVRGIIYFCLGLAWSPLWIIKLAQ